MKKNGFTLIELLAVIIILAVIALIATPIVLNVVEDARKKAAEQSVNGYISAVESARYQYLLNHNMEEPASIDDLGTITTKGETVTCTKKTITNGVFAAPDGCTTTNYKCDVENGAAKAGSCKKNNS